MLNCFQKTFRLSGRRRRYLLVDFYITTVWFFITEGVLVYFAFRYRRKPGKKAAYVLATP